jgi:hypothetical protein
VGDFSFELWVVTDPGIESGHSADGCVEMLEEFADDARGDFSSEAPGQRVFVSD